MSGLCAQPDCQAYPAAKCNINFCGEALVDGQPADIPICSEYYVLDRAVVECGEGAGAEVGGEVVCATPSDVVACLLDPCQEASCPAFPEAQCLSSYCTRGEYRGRVVGPCEALFVEGGGGEVVDCGTDPGGAEAPSPPPGAAAPCACDAVFEPVCCTGVDYANRCQAACAGEVSCQRFTCEEGCVCTQEVAPVCCGGKQYSNACLADCALAEGCQEGECEAAAPDALLVGTWSLLKIKQPGGLAPFPEASATLAFTSEAPGKGRLGGVNGCNDYGGDYSAGAGGALEVGPLVQTLKACLGAGGQLEALLMPLLQSVERFVVVGSRLRLFAEGEKVLVFVKDDN